MKPFCTFPLLLTLLLALGCGGGDEAADKESSDASIPDEGNQAAGGQQGMGPGGEGDMGMGGGDGQGGGAPGGEDGFGGAPGGEGGFGGAPGGEGGGFGGAPQTQQPTFDASLPAGKKQVWTKAKITTAWKGKSAAELIKSFGSPANHKPQGNFIVYFYDNMYVKEKNMKYSKVSFAIQPDGKGGGSVFAIGLVPNSATRIQPAGGQGGGFPGGDPGGGGFPGDGQGGGFPPGGKRPR